MSIQNLKYFAEIGFRFLTSVELIKSGISIVERWLSDKDAD